MRLVLVVEVVRVTLWYIVWISDRSGAIWDVGVVDLSLELVGWHTVAMLFVAALEEELGWSHLLFELSLLDIWSAWFMVQLLRIDSMVSVLRALLCNTVAFLGYLRCWLERRSKLIKAFPHDFCARWQWNRLAISRFLNTNELLIFHCIFKLL